MGLVLAQAPHPHRKKPLPYSSRKPSLKNPSHINIQQGIQKHQSLNIKLPPEMSPLQACNGVLRPTNVTPAATPTQQTPQSHPTAAIAPNTPQTALASPDKISQPQSNYHITHNSSIRGGPPYKYVHILGRNAKSPKPKWTSIVSITYLPTYLALPRTQRQCQRASPLLRQQGTRLLWRRQRRRYGRLGSGWERTDRTVP